MEYHIGRNGQQLGQFSLADLQAGYQEGTFLAEDLVWREGLDHWIPLSNLPELASAVPLESEAAAPPLQAANPTQFESPPQGLNASDPSASDSSTASSGPAWENPEEGGVFERAWRTIRSVITTPGDFFATLRVEGGLGQPLLFYIAVGWIALIINTLLETPLQLFLADSKEDVFISAMTPLLLVIFAPVFIAVSSFFSAGLTHLCLMMIGGANRPFEATFRVNCYAYGGVMPLSIVPFCGGFVAGIWGLILEIIGIAAAHQISTGKAAVAVLLPTVVCCGVVGGLVLAFAGTALFQMM